MGIYRTIIGSPHVAENYLQDKKLKLSNFFFGLEIIYDTILFPT